ncbi:histidine kinase [Streptomyces sp. MP131-18]|uniref:sensor histidine kinase n=1 Tax=Streptomyces sp. MP131-18 TaxID=1857892 RepID=UPI00097C096D|nr:histidine kinase [Streptomyces sp. MP131-18]ONK13491.1 sensory histidine kinase UhpB [Streptomyces sp. MP131-18]
MDDTGARETWEHRLLLPGELRFGGGRTPARRTGRDWLVDILMFGFAVLLWAASLGIVEDADYLPRWIVVADAPAGALACLALWWRRRFPLLLAVAMLPLSVFSSTFVGALSVAIFNLAVRVPWRTASLVVLAHLAVTTPYLIVYTIPDEGGWTGVAFVVAFVLFLLTWGTAVRVRRELVARLRADARRERAEHARRLADARRAEREAIAREMHDVLAHRISLLSVHAGALAYRTGASARGAEPLSDAEIGDTAQLIRDTAHQALEELREVLTVLRGSGATEGAPQPGLGDVEDLVAEARRAGQRVRWTGAYERAASGLRGQVQRTAYRVVQEGLTNARKHAPEAEVTVVVAGGPGEGLSIAVRNTLPARGGHGRGGVDAGPIPGAGAGLAGLEERVVLDGGTLRHGAGATAFELVAELPWPPAAPGPAG